MAAELRPATRAYHEIWLDGEKQVVDRGGGAVLRRPVPAAEVQDRGRPVDRQLRRHLLAGRGAARDRAGRPHPGLQPAGGRRARHDPQQGRHHRPAGPAARVRAHGARRRSGAPGGGDLPRPRQPERPPPRAAQVPAGRVGHRAVPRGVPAPRVVPARPAGRRCRRCRSTIISAATGSATGAGSTASSSRAAASSTPAAGGSRRRSTRSSPGSALASGSPPSRTCCSPASTPTASRPWSASFEGTASPCPASSRPRGGSRWPAPRSRPAAWRWPSRSARSPRSSTSSRPSSTASACATRRSRSG